jgi:hypothetical protein
LSEESIQQREVTKHLFSNANRNPQTVIQNISIQEKKVGMRNHTYPKPVKNRAIDNSLL